MSLIFTWGDGQLRAVALRAGQPLIVGRAPPAEVVLDDASLSRAHARFWLADGKVHFADLGSTNGSQLAGKAVAEGTLDENDGLRLGAVELSLTGSRRLPSGRDGGGGFRSLLEHEVERAHFFGRSLALIAVSADEAAQARIAGMLRPVDLHDAYAPNLSLVLLPESGMLELQSLAEALFRSAPGRYALGVVIASGGGRSADALIAEAIEAARAASPDRLQQATQEKSGVSAGEPIIRAACMQRVHALVERAARTTIPVLVLGETGSGKESIASSVHQRSARGKRPFMAVNCASLPTTLLASVLFGHERGAFTGADRQTPGLFEQAHTGTLFLDEVGELSHEAQASLLRVLETGKLTRVGSQKELAVDVRLVAATHRDLAQLVSEGKFRQDLLYRLDAFAIRVPPLRERVEEIAPLAEHFLALGRARWGSSARILSRATMQALEAYAWPGNVRQLRNVIERACAICTGEQIDVDDLPDALFESRASAHGEAPRAGSDAGSLPERLRRFEEKLLRDALVSARGNQSEAARLLGLPRRTLAHKVHAYGLVSVTSEGGLPG